MARASYLWFCNQKLARQYRLAFHALVVAAFCSLTANAAFLGDYSFTQWNLTNTNADGYVLFAPSGDALTLTGGNNGNGFPGLTDLTIVAPASGQVQFAFSYSSMDSPTFDFAGYLIGGTFFQLADTDGEAGPAQFTVSAGEVFGFRVATLDNQGEPGILTISSFEPPASVPEPGCLPVLLGMAAVIAAVQYRRARGRVYCASPSERR